MKLDPYYGIKDILVPGVAGPVRLLWATEADVPALAQVASGVSERALTSSRRHSYTNNLQRDTRDAMIDHMVDRIFATAPADVVTHIKRVTRWSSSAELFSAWALGSFLHEAAPEEPYGDWIWKNLSQVGRRFQAGELPPGDFEELLQAGGTYSILFLGGNSAEDKKVETVEKKALELTREQIATIISKNDKRDLHVGTVSLLDKQIKTLIEGSAHKTVSRDRALGITWSALTAAKQDPIVAQGEGLTRLLPLFTKVFGQFAERVQETPSPSSLSERISASLVHDLFSFVNDHAGEFTVFEVMALVTSIANSREIMKSKKLASAPVELMLSLTRMENPVGALKLLCELFLLDEAHLPTEQQWEKAIKSGSIMPGLPVELTLEMIAPASYSKPRGGDSGMLRTYMARYGKSKEK